MNSTITAFDLRIRYQIYLFLAEHCRMPSFQELASLLHLRVEAVSHSFHELHRAHLIFLEPGSDAVRMAFPFSGVPTKFKVRSGVKEWWANCAWDSLGIPAALHVDAEIEAAYPDHPAPIKLVVKNGKVDGKNHLVYFPLPCRQWYDDLVFT